MKTIFLELQKSYERLLKKKEKGVVQNYKESYKKLRRKLEKAYDKFEKDGDLKYSKKDIAKLDKDTASIMISLYKDNEKLIKSTLKEIFNKTKESSINQAIVPIKKEFNPEKVIEKEVAGRIWTERIKHYGNNFVYDVHSIIKAGLERGDTYTTMSKDLRKKFGKNIGNTVRIARTEGARVVEDTKFRTFEEINKNSKVKVIKIWHTMQDEAVRDTHQAMEGVEVGFDEEFILPSGASAMYPKASGVASEDINCRCYCEYKVANEEAKANDDIYDEKLNNYGEVLIDKNENFFNAENKDKEMTNFNEISREFLNSKTIKGRKVKNLPKSKYKIMNFKGDYNLVFDHDEYEKNIANWLAREIGGEIYLCPRVELPKGIRTPDYIWDNEKWDLKSINSHGKNTINTAIKNTKNQSKNVILNLIDDTYTYDDVYKEMNRIFSNSRYSYIEKVLLVENYKLRNIFKRN